MSDEMIIRVVENGEEVERTSEKKPKVKLDVSQYELDRILAAAEGKK